MFQVYILQSAKDHRTYVGYTHGLSNRLKLHNSGKVSATKYRIPFKVLFTEEFSTDEKPVAIAREPKNKNDSWIIIPVNF